MYLFSRPRVLAGASGLDGIVALKNLTPTPSAICNMGLLGMAARNPDFELYAGWGWLGADHAMVYFGTQYVFQRH